MNATVKKWAVAYGTFLAFAVVTTMLVRPAVKKYNVPLLKDVL